MRFDVIHRARRQDKLFWHRAPGSPKQPTARECYGCDLPARLPEAWRERAAHLITTCTDGWWRDNRRGFRANQRLAAWLDLVVNLVWSDDNPEAGDPLVLAAEAYAREAFAAGCTVADCARHVGLSRAQFHERYRRCRKEGPGTFLRCLRLASAEQLLLTSTNTVARIARQVGFNSASTFARAFRARSGFSPDEWRRRGA
jgi:AraC-like DNA-binding protein